MSVALIIFFLALGLLLLLIEVLITPGIVIGSIGVMFMGFGIYKVYADYGMNAGNITLAGSFLVSVLAVVIALRSKAWKRMSLKDTLEGKTNTINMDLIKPGDSGRSLSRLRPSGNALINGSRVEVVTLGESIDADQEIEVKEIRLNKIFVKLKN